MSTQAAAKTTGTSLSYDEVPYESFAYPQTHPSHVSTIATLFGLTPPDFKTARVLELGCAGGGNLFPLALLYPKASFIGIDLSAEQIAQANKHKQALNLGNVEFLQQDILAFAPKDKKKKFDYIICHGIFSWVPEVVREKIFTLCNEWLSPNGLAIISYNALPGWNAVRSLREMMLYHTNRFSKPEEKIKQARSLLDFLAENVPEGSTGYRAVIEDERKLLKNINNSYLYHDHLESVNTQFYLHDFAQTAKTHGLDYVGDTNITGMYVGNMPPKAMEALKVINDIVSQEQYMDFITNRRFRSSIVCKSGQKINRNLQNDQILNYFLTVNPAMEVIGADPKQNITFKVNNGSFTTHEAVAGTLFLELHACGQKPIAAKDLVACVQKKLGLPDAKPVQDILVAQGLQLFLRGYIHLRSDSPHFATEISPKPVAFPLARYEAGLNNCRTVTSVMSNTIPSDVIANLILQNLDGSKTVQDVAGILAENVKKGVLKMEKNGSPIKDGDEISKDMVKVVEDILPKMAKHGLLVG